MGQLLQHWRLVRHGACVLWPVHVPESDSDRWKEHQLPEGTPWTPDGTCGGAEGYRCSHEWGRCCNVDGICAENRTDCYLERGCQSAFGICASPINPGGQKGLVTTNFGDDANEPARTPRSRRERTPEETYQRMMAGYGGRFDIPLGGLEGIEMQAAGFSANLSGRMTTPHSNSAKAKIPKAISKPQVTSNSTDGKPLLKAASAADLARARSIVADAIAASAERNKARLANPARNQYRLKPGTVIGGAATVPNNNNSNKRRGRRQDQNGGGVDAAPTPLLEITHEIAWAAALVAEAEAVAPPEGVNLGTTHPVPSNSSSSGVKRRVPVRGTYWMETIARRGTVPWGDDPTYQVFRNVLDYGAAGNGVTDDTAGIKAAMNDGRRCGEKCNGSTTKKAIVYFPPDTYLVSSTIPLPSGMQVIGDVLNRPLIIASSSFVGLGVLSTDEYTGGGDQEWFVNTANFDRQLRNVIIDVRNAPANEMTACLHYQVAHATSL